MRDVNDIRYQIRQIWETLGRLPSRWAKPTATQVGAKWIPVKVSGRTVVANPGFGASDYTGVYDGDEVQLEEGGIWTTKTGGLTFRFTECTGIVDSVFGNMALEIGEKIIWVRPCLPSTLVLGASSSSSCAAIDVAAVSSSDLLGAWSYVCHEAHTNSDGSYVLIN